MAFPDDAELGTRVELNLGGVWTTVTSATRLGQLITITRGRADYASKIDPSKVIVQIRNPDGAFSPHNPVGPYYGLIKRNTPLRVSVDPGGTPWFNILADDRLAASTPDTAALDVLGDIDIRVDVQMPQWANPQFTAGVSNLITKYVAGQVSWFLGIANDGHLTFFWSPDGTSVPGATSSLSLPFLPGQRGAVRVTLDVDNGASGRTITFYTSTTPGVAGPWTQLGTPIVQAGVTSIFNSTTPVEVGRSAGTIGVPTARRFYAAQVRSGIGGTIVANPDFTAQALGATSFTDSAGRPWTVPAGAINTRDVRGMGEVPSWPSRWGSSGKLVTVNAEASGIIRRLGTGASPLDSTLRRRIPSDPNLIAYWPCEDGAGSAQAYSPTPGVRPMTTSGMVFAADDSLAGSSPLMSLSDLSSMRATVPASATGRWHVEFVYKIPQAPAGDANAQFIVINTTSANWRIGIGATTLHLDVTDPTGTSLYSSTTVPTDFFGEWGRFIFQAQPSGGSVAFHMAWVAIGGGGFTVDASFAGTVAHITSLTGSHGNALSGMSLGHFAVFDNFDLASGAFTNADTGFNGEEGAVRMVRLAGEESVPLRMPYGTTGTELMGPQRPDTLLALLQAAADADEGGILYEPRDAIGLAFRPRWSLYTQPVKLTLDYAQQQVGVPLEPEDDDQATRNDITVTRISGTSARATLDTGPMSTADPTSGGVGRYSDAVTLNLADDTQPEQHAWWRLHLGTYDGVRYPSVTINLARCPQLIPAARSLDIGDRIQILNPPPWLPPGTIDLIVQGSTEVMGIRTWTMTFNCSPAGPWNVGTLDDLVYGRADTDGSELAAGVSPTATALSVATTVGPLWTTDPAEYPMDLIVGGEVVTATACTGTSSPQTMTVIRAVNGVRKSQSAATDVRLAQPAITAL